MSVQKKFPHLCPIRHTLTLIGGKWKLPVIALLLDGSKRFTEIERAIPGISARMLIKELKDLETNTLLTRTVFATVPSRVEYHLTDAGRSLGPMLHTMHLWGAERLAAQGKAVPPLPASCVEVLQPVDA
ncbi:winged helix-turn-helix transcriptional regulator [Hymenobacter terricola]|uniref:winged helix-turn-helix transcriptional regulator n=1 Tax=Hymenobacter terricola TaxID=2819236 RepID=UPI001B315E59|nr:helix-turn-helix domain-containing protein [Hymenobacter terricola]